MTKKDYGGPAFPSQPIFMIPGGGEIATEQGGMTLRDYFAGKALMGAIEATSGAPSLGLPRAEVIAKLAYELADAMLAERKK